jgi:hypothetical protein
VKCGRRLVMPTRTLPVFVFVFIFVAKGPAEAQAPEPPPVILTRADARAATQKVDPVRLFVEYANPEPWLTSVVRSSCSHYPSVRD